MFDTSAAGLRRVIARGEGPFVELKSRFTADGPIARHLVAFANSGGGIMLFGVGERGNLLGLSEEEENYTIVRLKRLAAALLPTSLYQIGAAELDGKAIVYIQIEEAPESAKPIRLATGDALEMRDGMVVELGQAQVAPAPSRQVRAFVAMSFRNEEEPSLVDYYQAMRRAVESTRLPIDLVRIDLVEGDYEISQRIMDEIDASDIVLADFTLSPANVYFELGYARGCKRRVIQSARKETVLEFDTRNWRTIFYKNATELETALIPALEQAYLDVTAVAQ